MKGGFLPDSIFRAYFDHPVVSVQWCVRSESLQYIFWAMDSIVAFDSEYSRTCAYLPYILSDDHGAYSTARIRSCACRVQ